MKTILIVDDDPDVADFITCLLPDDRFFVETVDEGRLASAYIATRCFDVVILDILLPEKDGIELLREMRGMPIAPKVVAISGGGARIEASFGLQCAQAMGADAVLHKSRMLPDLPRLVERLAAA